MKILCAQLNPTVGDLKGNAAKVIEVLQNQNADLIVFPELCLTGYPPEDFLLLPHFIAEVERTLNDILPYTKGKTAIIGLTRRADKALYNSAAVLSDGKLLGYQDKALLPTYDVFDERRYFTPGEGFFLPTIDGKKIGITICEDIWQHSGKLKDVSYERDPVKELAAFKPDLVVNLSASPFHTGKFATRLHVCCEAAKTLKCPLILCNQVGGNDSLVFDGYSLAVNPEGKLMCHAQGFVEQIFEVKEEFPEEFHPEEIADLHDALVLGIKDYFAKSGFSKACLGLSGGIDSAVVACLAAKALGHENVLGVGMPSRYSSQGSITDAMELARHLDITYRHIPIEEPFKSYLELLTPHLGTGPGITEENLQARIRGMILMAFANKFHYILLSTGNKSELAMGYSTLYGDMCGGLNPLSDVTKGQVYALANYINREKIIIPKDTLTKPPSAELAPNQKDSDSLPDYAIIDNVLNAYVAEHKSPQEISQAYNYPLEQVIDLIKRIHRNEYKRRQSPPGIRVSEKAFSVGRRFPIVQKWT